MSNRVLSEKQQNHLSRFELAKKYGRMVCADEELSALYSVLLKPWKKKKKNSGNRELFCLFPHRIYRVMLPKKNFHLIVEISLKVCIFVSGNSNPGCSIIFQEVIIPAQ